MTIIMTIPINKYSPHHNPLYEVKTQIHLLCNKTATLNEHALKVRGQRTDYIDKIMLQFDISL